MENPNQACIKAWKNTLRDLAFASSERRANAVARFLVNNDFYSVEDWRGARHPSVWEGASEIFESMRKF
jgi:hypothetical protein